MAVTCRLFRTIASYTDTPEGIVTALNDALSETNESCMFCTVFVGVLDIRNGNLRYCNAGHNPPVILQPDGDVFTLNILPNIALGVWNGYEFKGESYNMQRGSALFMYTDGVTEAEDMDKSLYGEQRLLDLLRREDSRSARIITEHVVDDIARHAGDAIQSDDITILCCSLDQLHTNDTRSLVMTNKIEEIERMTSFIEEICQENNLSVEDTFNIHLAVEEAVTNVIMYAYPQGEEHEFLLDVHVLENRLIFKIIDSGKEFDPTLQPDADVTLSLEERPIGGLGIFLIRQIMQTVDYRRVDGKNILTMVKMIN
jgi:sigma-B regulation protein RsbU (phosphoserine phosphatase)